jgi:hypothetical protein
MAQILERLIAIASPNAPNEFGDLSCQLYYSMVKEGFPYWPQLVGCFTLAAVGCVAFVIVTSFSGRTIIGFLYRGGAIIFALVWVWIGLYIYFDSYLYYRRILETTLNGAAQTMEGRVTNFRPAASLGARIEQFSIGAVTFSYSPNLLAPGFRLTRAEGNPIHDGDQLKVWYVNGTIVQIEMCRT